MEPRKISRGKFEDNCINEDAALARKKLIAVSDGAGGGGLFAERWSKYMLDKLPDAPFGSADALDEWIGSIWEDFYDECEKAAKELGPMSLNKFYDEGSYATLVAVWRTAPDACTWVAYGDSVAFHYNCDNKRLEHCFSKLADFDQPPYLINCKDPLRKEGFRTGTFKVTPNSVVFAASDALSHYIMMMYEILHEEEFRDEIDQAISHHSKNENYIHTARMLANKIRTENNTPVFYRDVLKKLKKCVVNENKFSKYLRRLEQKGVLAHDDYSFALMPI